MKRLSEVPVFFWITAICFFTLFLSESQITFLCANPQDFLSGHSLLGCLRLITYQFIHAGWDHFFGNFFFAMMPALYLEHRLGKLKFVSFYVACGIFSALSFMLSTALSPFGNEMLRAGKDFHLLGASGSIFGVLTYALLLWGKEAWWKAVLVFAAFIYIFIPQFIYGLVAMSEPQTIAYWGHIGGYVGALFLAFIIKPIEKKKKR